MELYERQQFDFMLMTAAERFSERVVQRAGGAENAVKLLRDNPDGDKVWLNEFVENLFGDFLLNNTAGACFILAALEKRELDIAASGRVDAVLQQAARRVFGELLQIKIVEALEQSLGTSG